MPTKITTDAVEQAAAAAAEMQETSDEGFLRKRAPLRELMAARRELLDEDRANRRGDVLSSAQCIAPRRG